MVDADDARAVLRKIVEVFNTGDVRAVPSLFSEDYLDHQGLDWIEIRGHDGFCRVVAATRSGFDRLDVTIEDEIVEGEKVVGRLRWHGNRANGDVSVRETIDILRLSEGRVVEHWGARISA